MRGHGHGPPRRGLTIDCTISRPSAPLPSVPDYPTDRAAEATRGLAVVREERAPPHVLCSWPMTARFLGWSALALVSLLVGAIALSPSSARGGWGGPAARLVLELP